MKFVYRIVVFCVALFTSAHVSAQIPVNDGCHNAISIQNDGLNESFKVVGIGYTNIKIQIFNRWGERLYESDNFTEWDGTYMGKKVQMGAYIYIMTITDNRGMKHHMNGEIQVMR